MKIYSIFKSHLTTVLKAETSAKKVDWFNAQYEHTENEKATRYPALYIELMSKK